ncbi:universal stress protein [Pseudomonadota bacterium]
MSQNTKISQSHPVLVPVDFSEHSEAALMFASQLAECMACPLMVLHVVHDPGDAPGFYAGKQGTDQLKKMEDVASEMMDDFLKRITMEHPDSANLKLAETMLLVGLPVTRILEAVDKLQARMVVMGSKGRTGLSHILLGSKAEQIVRLSPIPVTIVKVQEE